MKKNLAVAGCLASAYCFLVVGLNHSALAGERSIWDMSLEELGQIQVKAGSLLSQEKRYSPNSVTVITREMIEASGARRLPEVLATYVPSFQWLRHPALPDRLGMRGMISDLNNKMLLLVNGKVMNSQPLLGIDSEVDLSMLGDIEKIEVVNGPGSATYGSGALNGVIDITTRNADNFSGTEVSVRGGAVEAFNNVEVQWAGKLPTDAKLYLYYGQDAYQGSDKNDSPVYFGSSFNVKGSNLAVRPGTAVDLPFLDDRAADRDRRQKVYVDLRKDDFNLWARYTEGGTSGLRAGRRLLINNGFVADPGSSDSLYRQFSSALNYSFVPATDWRIDSQLAFDQMNASWYLNLPSYYESSEEKYSGKITAKWNPSETQALAVGLEYMHGEYAGIYSPQGTSRARFQWNTDYYALLAEHFWHFLPEWRSILSARVDKRTESDYVVSPRMALLYEPTPTSNFTISASRSNRLGDEYYHQYYQSIGSPSPTKVEKVDTLEFLYNQRLGSAWNIQTSLYRSKQDILAWDPARRMELLQGVIDYHGLDLVLSYKTERNNLSLSHAYTQLESMELDAGSQTLLTSEPYGYGNDFHMVPRHMTKLSLNHKYNDKLTLFASLQHIWKYEGAEDFARYNQNVLRNLAATTTDLGSNIDFVGPTTLNLSAIYAIHPQWKAILSAHNALGWVDKDFNKQRYYSSMDTYRIEAPALSLQIMGHF